MIKIAFNSASLPGDQHLRAEQWIEALSSGYVRLGADPSPGLDFKGRLKIIRLANASIGTLEGTIRNISRTAADVAIENTDNVVLLINQDQHAIRIEQKGRLVDCAAGGAVLIEQCEPSAIHIAASNLCNIAAIQVPRDQVHRYIADLSGRFLRPFAAPTSALLLTRAYVDFLLDAPPPDRKSPFIRFASEHLSDLTAAILDSDEAAESAAIVAVPEAIETRQGRGVRAARLLAIKRDMTQNLGDSSLSLPMIAARHGISPRYVHKLFEDEGTAFTAFLIEQRLARAYEMLADPRYLMQKISAISHDCGFHDLSWFHRTFRRRYGATPSDIREAALRARKDTH
jgi:AraC-like DNA-binding protein